MSDLTTEVQDRCQTELSRLNSSKALFAMTEGEMSQGPLLRALVTRLDALEAVYREWAESEDGDLAEIAAEAADTLAEQGETLRGIGEQSVDSATPADDPLARALTEYTDVDTRRGAIVGEALVTGKLLDQVVGFFVGNADPGTASTIRELRDATADRRRAAQEGAPTADSDAALDAATAIVGAAYEDYVDRLEAQGVNPKPVC